MARNIVAKMKNMNLGHSGLGTEPFLKANLAEIAVITKKIKANANIASDSLFY